LDFAPQAAGLRPAQNGRVERPKTAYARSGSVRIAYQVVGDGTRDIVFMPGFVSHADLAWEDPHLAYFYRRLVKMGRLILFDKRGTGMSDPVVEHFSVDQRMDDLRAVMDGAGSREAVLFGVSEGGSMAMLFAARYPERVTRLVLHSAVARMMWAEDHPWAWSKRFLERFVAASVETWGTGQGAEIPNPSLAGDLRYREWFARYTRVAASPGQVAVLLAMNGELDIRDVLPNISQPTLVTHRTDERWVKVEESRYIGRSIPGARLVEFAGADHWPLVGDTDAILRVVEEFVTGVKPRRRAGAAAVGPQALSPREEEVVRLAVAGFTAPETATRLGIGERTIEAHLAHAYTKLDVRTRGDLMRRYGQLGV
jgi:pimeloyl-ACP methyl ester carboxylesterase/DNA-binding CsgD family transcriptional regulator